MAAMRDLGSRDVEFINIIKEVRSGLLKTAGVSEDDWSVIPVQGSGTFGVEATLTSSVPKGKKILIVANGAYGLRMSSMMTANDIEHLVLECHDNEAPSESEVQRLLEENADITHVAMVHSETTSGIVNDVESMGKIVQGCGRSFIVDAMSSFGGIPVKLDNIDYIVSSSNKCIEGIPGFSFCIARKAALAATEGNARSLSLDIHAQVKGLDKDGQFRFTPPCHSLLAFRQALSELELEGGVEARNARYVENQRVLNEGMDKLGFKLYLENGLQGPIISSYHYPGDKNWDFTTFYEKLNELDFVIYPGKVSKADCFRIGHIGRLFPEDTTALLGAIDSVSKEMKTATYYEE